MQKVAFFLENELVDSNGHKSLDAINSRDFDDVDNTQMNKILD